MEMRCQMVAVCALLAWVATDTASAAEQLVLYDFEQSGLPATTVDGVAGSDVCSPRGPWYLSQVSGDQRAAMRLLPTNVGGTLEWRVEALGRRILSVETIDLLCDISDGTNPLLECVRGIFDGCAGP